MKVKLNCMTTKHQAAEKIWEKLSVLTPEQELKFWQEKSIALKKKKQGLWKKLFTLFFLEIRIPTRFLKPWKSRNYVLTFQ